MKHSTTTLGQAAALAGAAPDTPKGKRRAQPLPPPPPPLWMQQGGFGGRQHRYLVQKGQQVRAFDPVAMRHLNFSHERFYLLWLVHRFDPTVRDLDAAPKEVAYLNRGYRIAATPSLQWKRAGEKPVLCFLLKSWPIEERIIHQHFAVTHKATVVLMPWDWFDDKQVLLENLEHARQIMTSAAFAGARLDCVAKAIYRHMKNRTQCTRGELGAELSCEGCLECDEYLDATLFHLHALGGLHIEFSDREYSDDTVIRHP
ncbi:MAG: hypothetical protein ACK44A_00390 [Roseateles sp.]